MAATAIINNKFLNYKTYNAFKVDLDAGFILNSSIVLIDDVQWIWSHGTYWKCEEFDSTEIENAINTLEGKVETIEGDENTEGSIAHAVKTLETAIDTRLTTVEGNVSTNQTAIQQEVTDRQNAIAGLNGNITSTAKQPFTSISETAGIVTASTGNINAGFVDVEDSEDLFTATTVEGVLAEIAKEVDSNTTNIGNISDSIDTKISAEIQKLDSEITSNNGTHVEVTVTEEDGKITAVSVNESDIASAETLSTVSGVVDGLVDSVTKLEGDATTSGSVAKAVSDAKAEILGDVAADYNTLGKLEDKIQEVAQNANTYQITAVEGADLTALGTNVKEAWKLVDKDGIQAGSTIKIYKDSNLKSVVLDDQVLKFTYILTDGTENEVPVDISKFLADSEFTNGLQVVSGVVSVALADNVEGTNDNYLVLEGEEGSKKLAVRNIKTDDTVLQKDIRVAGLTGILGAGNYANDDVIPAGTDIYTILQNILCKELYPTATSKQGTITASVAAPTITTSSTGTVEVGTLVTMTAATCPNSTVTTTNSTVTGMDYGYSTADDDDVENNATSLSKSWTTAPSGKNYAMSATVTGFNANSTTATTPTAVSAQSMASTQIGYVAEGSNTLKISVTGDSFTGSVDGIDSMFLGSNLGNTDAAKKTTAVAALTNKESNIPTNSKTVTITGVYKYFMGYSTNTSANQFDSASVRALTTKTGNITKDSTTTIVSSSTPVTSNGTSIIIACPKKYKLATIQNGVGASILANFTSGTVSVTTGSINTDYTVYVYPITNGATVEFKNVTLTKA